MAKRRINPRAKGKAGELEAAELLRGFGLSARRSQQFSGKECTADLNTCLNWHIEVKRVERLNLDEAMEQAVRDSAGAKPPLVLHRRNGKPWMVTVMVRDFFPLVGGQDFSDL